MKKVFVDYKKCLACKACETACALEHHPSHSLFGALGDSKTQINVRVLGVEHEAFPLSCRHCDPADCLDACPSGVIELVGDTAEAVNEDDCTGCESCLEECPMGAITEIEED